MQRLAEMREEVNYVKFIKLLLMMLFNWVTNNALLENVEISNGENAWSQKGEITWYKSNHSLW